MVDRMLLVDGNNLLFQMFFGMPARIFSENGTGIWGVLGFVGALLKMIRMVEPGYLAVLFDGEHENGRTAIDADYKQNRVDFSQVPAVDNPFSQLPYIYMALDAMNIAHAETLDCEADDWISGYAGRYAEDFDIVIASFDSDFFQLIGRTVRVLRYRGKGSIICDEKYLQERYGIQPCQYADFKALTGDAADNIKGASHVGPKTAAALLREFGTLESVIKSAAFIAKPSVKRSVMENTERLLRNYQLIKLEGCSVLPLALSEMKYAPNDRKTMEVLREIGLG